MPSPKKGFIIKAIDSMHQKWYTHGAAAPSIPAATLEVKFYRHDSGSEPVRDWLKTLPKACKKAIGEDIKTVQFGWPIGMPVVKKSLRVAFGK